MGKPGVLYAMVACAFFAPVACQGARQGAEELARRSQPLALQVSSEFDVERYPAVHPPVGVVDTPIFACGTQRCFAFYGQEFSLVATRIDKTGRVVDEPPIVVGPGAKPLAAAARGDDFIVIWSDGNARKAAQLRGSDGQVVADFSARLPAADLYQLVSNGSSWLLAYSGSGYSAVVKTTRDFANVGTPVAIPTSVGLTVVPGSAQYLAAWRAYAVRISEASGAALDNPPIAYSKYSLGAPHGAYKNGVYQLIWSGDNDYVVYGSRIRASDGARLDPDDDFNQVTGAKRFFSGPAYDAFVQSAGALLIGAWSRFADSQHYALDAARIDISSGMRVDGSTGAAETSVDNLLPIDLTLNADWGAASTPTGLAPLTVQGTPFALHAGAEPQIRLESDYRSEVAVASNGTGFLVCWVTGADQIMATRIDGTTGAYLDDPPLKLGVGRLPSVAASGSQYLVVWQGATKELVRRFVPATGTPGPTLAGIAEPGFAMEIKLTFNNRYFYMSWTQAGEYALYGMRLKADGSPLDAAPVLLNAKVSSDRKFTTLADISPPENMRTFLTVFAPDLPGAPRLRRVRSESGAVIDPETSLSGGFDPHAASDGTSMLVASYFVGDNTVKGVFVDPVNGTEIGLPKSMLTSADYARVVHAWFDGKSYLLAIRQERPNFAYYVERFRPDLSPLDANASGTVVVPELTGAYPYLAIAGNGAGRSLFVYTLPDPKRHGTAVKARLLANDGSPSTGSGGTGSGGSGGSGGTSGGIGGAAGGPDSSSGSGGTTDSGSSGGSTGVGGTPDASRDTGAPDSAIDAGGGFGGTAVFDAGTDSRAGSGGSTGSAGDSTSDAAPRPDASGSSGTSGAAGRAAASGGSAGASAPSAPAPAASDDAGCGCRLPEQSASNAGAWWIAALCVGARMRRRREQSAARKPRGTTLSVTR